MTMNRVPQAEQFGPIYVVTAIAHRGPNRRSIVKAIVHAVGIASLIALAACGSKKEDAVENAYDNQAENLENQADMMEEKADNTAGAAGQAMENKGDMLENKADATREAGEKAADNATR
jgi:hypothetical protein